MKLLLGKFPQHHIHTPATEQHLTLEEYLAQPAPPTGYDGAAISLPDQISTDQKMHILSQVIHLVRPGFSVEIVDPPNVYEAFEMLRRFDLRDYSLEGQTVSATKPEISTGSRIAVVMSTPRYGAVLAQSAVYAALIGLGSRHVVDLVVNQGVWWHHGMTRTFEQVLEQVGLDYILTLDFDTMCTSSDLELLVETANLRGDIDALFPIQVRRSRSGPLLSGTNLDLRQSVVLANRGHFGATLFRPALFHRLPKPWFKESPDENQSWGDDRIDADMGFWDNVASIGGRVGCLLDVGLGHLEEMIAIPVLRDGRIDTHHVTPAEWASLTSQARLTQEFG